MEFAFSMHYFEMIPFIGAVSAKHIAYSTVTMLQIRNKPITMHVLLSIFAYVSV